MKGLLLLLALVASTAADAQARKPRRSTQLPPDLQRPVPVETPTEVDPAEPVEPTPATAPPPRATQRPGPCRRGPSGIPLDPVRTSFAEADLTSPRRPCARTELAFVSRAAGLVDTGDGYSTLRAAAVAEGSLALTPKLELFASAELFAYENAHTATTGAQSYGLGQTTAGASLLLSDKDGLAYAASARLLLPTSTVTRNIRTVGVEAGLPLAYTLNDDTFLHGYAGADLTAGLGGPLLPQFGFRVTAGGELHPTSTFAIAADLTARLGTRSVFEELTPSVALRLRAAKRLWLELAAALPVAGPRGVSFLDGLQLAPLGTFRISYRP